MRFIVGIGINSLQFFQLNYTQEIVKLTIFKPEK